MKPRRLFFLLTAVLLLLCAACKPTRNPGPAWTPQPGWGNADLRLFDPPDAANPQHDLTTLYARTLDGEAQIRLELLDHAPLPDYDLYLAFDLRPGGATRLPGGAPTALEWDLLVVIPAGGSLQVLDEALQPVSGAALSVVRRPDLAWLSISLNLHALFGHEY